MTRAISLGTVFASKSERQVRNNVSLANQLCPLFPINKMLWISHWFQMTLLSSRKFNLVKEDSTLDLVTSLR